MVEDLTFDHIGVVVSDLVSGEEYLRSIFPIKDCSTVYNDEIINVSIKFLIDKSGVRYELIAPLNEKSPLYSVLKTKKDVINHVAYKTGNFEGSIAHYKNAGCFQLGEPVPAIAFNNKKVVFFLTGIGAIVELVED
ncbi:MAG: VOC family protein [Gammaproteobacteria bacterium]|nr:VOC family protein [Gammaproteobacteria bacterium]